VCVCLFVSVCVCGLVQFGFSFWDCFCGEPLPLFPAAATMFKHLSAHISVGGKVNAVALLIYPPTPLFFLDPDPPQSVAPPPLAPLSPGRRLVCLSLCVSPKC